jgi:GTPase
VAEADVVMLLCDGQEGPTTTDEEVIAWLRRVHSSKPVILAVNKCESATQGELQAASFWNYGHEPLAVSAISGVGTGLMMERLIAVCYAPPVTEFL